MLVFCNRYKLKIYVKQDRNKSKYISGKLM